MVVTLTITDENQQMDALPQNPIEPQTFKPFIRHGFVYVEWGGLKI